MSIGSSSCSSRSMLIVHTARRYYRLNGWVFNIADIPLGDVVQFLEYARMTVSLKWVLAFVLTAGSGRCFSPTTWQRWRMVDSLISLKVPCVWYSESRALFKYCFHSSILVEKIKHLFNTVFLSCTRRSCTESLYFPKLAPRQTTSKWHPISLRALFYTDYAGWNSDPQILDLCTCIISKRG